jgi:hypothetical protein
MVDIGSFGRNVPDGRIAVLGRHRIAFCPQEEKNYDAGAKKLLD